MHKTTAVVFEGGIIQGQVAEAMQPVRHAACLDTLELLIGLPQHYDRVILATNFEELAKRAISLGVEVIKTTDSADFHLGQELHRICSTLTAKSVLYLSGAGSPLLSQEEFAYIANELAEAESLVITNNPQSSDIVGFTPLSALGEIELPAKDNSLGYLLRRDAGLPRQLLAHSVGVHFDIDTPTDILTLKLVGFAGERLRTAIDDITWDMAPYLRFKAAMTERINERTAAVPRLWMSGRIGGPVIQHINTHLITRLRVLSEERGMQSMGQEGMVCSFLGSFLDDVGISAFFRYLERSSDAALIDTRPLFAHFRLTPDDNDRFSSDLLLWQDVDDPWIREFTKAAANAKIPVLLGGHTLILGGIWAMVEAFKQ